jgi:hypothetical protein
MSSPQQILGDQCDHTMKRLGITSADWWKKVGECEGDATKVKAWVDEMEAMTTEDTANAVADAVIADVVTDVVAVDAVKDVVDAVIADVVAADAVDAVKDVEDAVIADVVAADAVKDVVDAVIADVVTDVIADVVAADAVDAVKDAVAAVVADVVAADADEDVVAVPAPTPKPKRAKSAWTVYFTANRAEFKLQNPDVASKGIMGALGKIWKTLDDASKAPFVKIAEDDKIRYKKEMETYIPDPSASTKKTKVKKAKKTKTPKCSKQCIARKFSLVGDKQCSKACVSDTHDFCKRCQTHADNYDGKCGPALWKYCHDNGISRENTKSKGTPGLWFGRIDDTESEFDYPGSSFVSTEGVRVVVLAFPKNENHDAVSTWQISENAILAHDTTLKENWPKKYHKLGNKVKKTKATKSKTKVVVETDAVGDIFAKEDDASDSVEKELSVEEDEEDMSQIVSVGHDGLTYNVNIDTMEVVDGDGDTLGDWEMPPNMADKPTVLSEMASWLSVGWPDSSAENEISSASDEDADDE